MNISFLRSFFVVLFLLSHAEADVVRKEITAFIIKNTNDKELTVKIMPNDMKLNAVKGLLKSGDHKGVMNKVKILPNESATVKVTNVVNIPVTDTNAFYERTVYSVIITGAIGLRKPGACAGLSLDGIPKRIEFKSDLGGLGIKCDRVQR